MLFYCGNAFRGRTAFAEIKQSAESHPHFGSCILHDHWCCMYQPDLTPRTAGVIDQNERHLGAQPKLSDRIGTMDLQYLTVLPGNQTHHFPCARANPRNVLTGFRANVDSWCTCSGSPWHTSRAIASDTAPRVPSAVKRLMLKGCPLGRCLSRCAMRVDTGRVEAVCRTLRLAVFIA